MRKAFATLNTGSRANRQPRKWGGQPSLPLAAVLHPTARRFINILALLLLLLAATLKPSFAQDGARQSEGSEQVDLLVFAAEQQDELVQVAWQVGAQSSSWNFTVYRSDSRDFAAAEPVDAPIFSSSSIDSPVIHYSLSDESTTPATYYWLVALSDESNQQVLGPYTVQQRLALFLPLVFQNR